MSKYIKLEDAIYGDCILIGEIKCEDCPCYNEERFSCRMVEWLESLATIEVVRCEDCVWRDKDNQGDDYCTYAKGLADIGEESFCSWGNRIKK